MAKKSDWNPALIGLGVVAGGLLVYFFCSSLRKGASKGYVGAVSPQLPAVQKQPSRSYDDCGCGM